MQTGGQKIIKKAKKILRDMADQIIQEKSIVAQMKTISADLNVLKKKMRDDEKMSAGKKKWNEKKMKGVVRTSVGKKKWNEKKIIADIRQRRKHNKPKRNTTQSRKHKPMFKNKNKEPEKKANSKNSIKKEGEVLSDFINELVYAFKAVSVDFINHPFHFLGGLILIAATLVIGILLGSLK